MKAAASDSGAKLPPANAIVRQALKDELSLCLENDFHVRCLCHVDNSAVVDKPKFIKMEIDMLRLLFKSIRGAVAIRVKLAELAVLLGFSTGRVEVPGLIVETRWNSMFPMVDQSFKYYNVFQSFEILQSFQIFWPILL